MKFSSLLRILRLCAGLEQIEIARLLKISQPTVSRWETGRGLPDDSLADTWARICRERIPDDRGEDACLMVRQWYASSDDDFRSHLVPRLDLAALALVTGSVQVYEAMVPYYADVAAGIGEAQEQRLEPRRQLGVPREVYARDPGCYALRVTGNSMAPQLLDGDLVVVSPAALLISGCIVAAFVEPDGDVVKQYIERGDGAIVLEPLNPSYDSIVLEPDGEREARIWGRVVLQQREL